MVLVEVVEVCSGIFGCGVYVGYLGSFMKDFVIGFSFNLFGFCGYKFLLLWMWDLKIFICVG